MNHKHIACLAVLFLCVVIVQGVSIIRNRATDMQSASELARLDADTAAITLRTQSATLADLQQKTTDLVEYLNAWEPHLSSLSTAESAELNVTSLIKQNDLILLAQRFELSATKSDATVSGSANVTIPQIVRAHLTIEDDFIKSLNWLGEVESKLPTARISNLEIARGQSGNDVRLNLVIDIPLASPPPTPTPATP